MVTVFWIKLITLYQSFISPYKGFNCAHNARYKSGSCSNAVKDLIANKGLIQALPLIRLRFRECRIAYEAIQATPFKSDLPCVDVSCGGELLWCGGDAVGASDGVCDCLGILDDLLGWGKRSKRTKRLIIIAGVLSVVILTYVFYGRGIANVMITDLGVQNQSIFKRISQREYPEVRVLVVANSVEVYSDIIKLDQPNKEYKLRLKRALNDFRIDQLQVLDARLKVGKELLVVGQELEVFEDPQVTGEGRRFKYRLKRRWHF